MTTGLDEYQRNHVVFEARIPPELDRLSLDQLRKFYAADIAAALRQRKERP